MIRMMRRGEFRVTVRPSVHPSYNFSKNNDILIKCAKRVPWHYEEVGVGEIGLLPRPQSAIKRKRIKCYN